MAMIGSMALAAPAFAEEDYNNPSGTTTIQTPTTTVQTPAPNPPPPPVIMHNTNTTSPPSTVVVPQSQPQQPAVVVNPQNVNRDTEVTTRAYPGLIWGGATMFGVSYGAAAIGGAVANDVCREGEQWACLNNRSNLYIPVVGPFMAMNDVEGTGSSTAKALLALDGAFQIAGIAMSVTGIIMSAVPTQARTDTMVPVAKKKAKKQLLITPYATGTGTGIGAMGTW